MKKLLYISFWFLIVFGCTTSPKEETSVPKISQEESTFKLYSSKIKDTFFVSVSLPQNAGTERTKRYPVIYLLDANLHFDIMAATFKHYSEVNLLPEAILVGIGYRNIYDLDSIRNRDLTFPKALPKYEMWQSGGANEFQNFIQTDLFNYIESKYPVDASKRVLMGHSLSGYFTLFAMHQNLVHKNNAFAGYIAASPSLHYNDYYLLKEFDKLNSMPSALPKVFVTYGGMEDAGEGEDLIKRELVLQQLTRMLSENNKVTYKGEIYSNIDHMNMSFPSFVKGLQWTFDMEE